MPVRAERYTLPVELHEGLLTVLDKISTDIIKRADVSVAIGTKMTIYIIRQVLDTVEAQLPVAELQQSNDDERKH